MRKNRSGNSLDRFKTAAKAVGASDDEAAFDRALGKIAKAPPPETVRARKTMPRTRTVVKRVKPPR